jgi:hypothetical protein
MAVKTAMDCEVHNAWVFAENRFQQHIAQPADGRVSPLTKLGIKSINLSPSIFDWEVYAINDRCIMLNKRL